MADLQVKKARGYWFTWSLTFVLQYLMNSAVFSRLIPLCLLMSSALLKRNDSRGMTVGYNSKIFLYHILIINDKRYIGNNTINSFQEQ